MTMPAFERRSPASLSTVTKMRSCSIWIGSLSAPTRMTLPVGESGEPFVVSRALRLCLLGKTREVCPPPDHDPVRVSNDDVAIADRHAANPDGASDGTRTVLRRGDRC